MRNDTDDFFVGYGPLPSKDRRFLLGALPVVGLGVAALALGAGTTARSSGGGRWETGTPVTMTGRLAFMPYPVLWTPDGDAHVLSGVGKIGADPYLSRYVGQMIQISGTRIVRGDCSMLGVERTSVRAAIEKSPVDIPEPVLGGRVSMVGEIVDAQCYMGIMDPGYGRTHRGCAAQCIRGGQPVFFTPGPRPDADSDGQGCGDLGFLLAAPNGSKANAVVEGHVAVPVILEAVSERIGPLKRLTIASGGLSRLAR